MARHLVVCIDGTGDYFDSTPTNIIRLHRCLAGDSQQVLAYYDQGVGTFGFQETLFDWQNVPAKTLGLLVGWGLKRNVQQAYSFLAQHWQPGDRIFMFGFSRGAFAVRALAALVHGLGLLPAHQLNLFDAAWSLLQQRDKDGQPNFAMQEGFDATFCRRVPIEFLGLFDTVKSVGWVYDPLILPWTTSNPSVARVRQALSLDERRAFFRPNLWRRRSGQNTDVRQVWFAGVHADVGGGYPQDQSQQALITLRWMLAEALSAGLPLDRERVRAQLFDGASLPDPCAPLHDSLQGAWWLAEWIPRRAWCGPTQGKRWTIGAMPPFGKPKPRFVANRSMVHQSVKVRMDKGIYHPVNLPGQYEIVDDLPGLGLWLEERQAVLA